MTNAALIGELAEGRPLSDAAACMAPLLDALTWRGTTRQMAEAVTAPWEAVDLRDLRNTLANLNIRNWARKSRLGKIDRRLLPCVFKASAEAAKPKKGSWFRPVARRFEPFAVQFIVLSLALNTLALATPPFVMAVYDQVIAAKSDETLVYLGIGVGMALACDAVIRLMRSPLLAFIGGRLDLVVNNSVVDRIMDLPLARLEKASVGMQLSRLREFEGIRGFFAGPMTLALLELPFVLIFLTAIGIIGGWLAAVPLVLMAALGGGALLALRYAKTAVADTAAGNSDCQSVLIEILENRRFIKDEGTEDIWLERYRERSTQLALANLSSARINGRVQVFAQAIMMTAGATMLAVGAGFAIDGQFSVGALIACMALVWRVPAPLQTLFLALIRVEEVRNAVARVDQLMAQPSETQLRSSGETVARDREFAGRITFNRVVMRYTPINEPALAGVSFEIEPGEIVCIIGANGSGKSTIMKLIADLYKPQAGTVAIDGVDTRQLNVIDLRNSIGYLPQKTDIFAGTLLENLKVTNPTARRTEVENACHRAGILDDVYSLPHGLDTALDEQTVKQVSTGFRKGLALARTLLCKSNITLFDEPAVGLDVESDEMLKRQIEEFRGRVTTLIVTHRPDYVQLADRVLALRDGRVAFDGPPSELAGIGQGGRQSHEGKEGSRG